MVMWPIAKLQMEPCFCKWNCGSGRTKVLEARGATRIKTMILATSLIIHSYDSQSSPYIFGHRVERLLVDREGGGVGRRVMLA